MIVSRRLSHLAAVYVSNVDKLTNEGEIPVRLCNYVDVYKNETVHPGLDLMEATATPSEIARFRLVPGDTVFTKDSETADDIGVPAFVTETADDFVCGYHLAIARPRQGLVDPKYLYWWLRSSKVARQWEVRASGVTRVGLRQTDIGKLSLEVVDDVEIQHSIAEFLDQETAQIDATIDAQQRLIRLLDERERVVVLKAVSTGFGELAPEATMESGLMWAGRVPSHWSVGNIRRFAAMKTGHTPSRQVPEYWVDCEIPWFTLADVWQLRSGITRVMGTAQMISEIGLANSAAELLPPGTVMVSRTASVGFFGIMGRPMATSQDYWNWVCGPLLDPEYLLYSFRAMRPALLSLMAGSTHKTIYEADAAGLRVLVPPLAEQRVIVEYLDNATIGIKRMRTKAQASIDLLRERRAALITAAVTGRLDPRTGVERLDEVLEVAS